MTGFRVGWQVLAGIDTIYAEGQTARRVAFARFMRDSSGHDGKPDVDD